MLERAVHPGLVLKEELAEIGITATEYARQINEPPNPVSQIIYCRRTITGGTAIRFGEWFGVEPEFWLNLQTLFVLMPADQDLGKRDCSSANISESMYEKRILVVCAQRRRS